MSSDPAEFAQKADEAFTKLQGLMSDLEEAKDTDTARYDALKAEIDKQGAFIGEQKEAEQKARRDQEFEAVKAQVADIAKGVHAPSKANAITGSPPQTSGPDQFFVTLELAQNPKAPMELRQQAQKALLDMGSTWSGVPDYSKATLGDTDAAGGYIVPNNIIAELTRVASTENPYRRLLTVVTGVKGTAIDVPHQGLSPSRAVVIGRGATKTNVNLSLANYTATFYTLAVIYDISNQLLRQSQGAAEKLVRTNLAEALAQGESYYILNGSGSSEPKGILTSVGTSGTFVTTHSSPSLSTVAGNFASAIAKAAGALAGRNRTPNGVVMNPSDFWTSLTSGDDTAGFYIAPNGGPTSLDATGAFSNGAPALSIWGLPVYVDNNMPSDSLVVGAWKGAQLFIGEDYRVDTSSEAGDRWDKNLTGFRAEEEMAFNADPYVSSGLFQRIVNVMA